MLTTFRPPLPAAPSSGAAGVSGISAMLRAWAPDVFSVWEARFYRHGGAAGKRFFAVGRHKQQVG
jgi:hypothetical protein